MEAAEHPSGRLAVEEAGQESRYIGAVSPEVVVAAFPYAAAACLARPENPYTADLTELDRSLWIAERMGFAAVQVRVVAVVVAAAAADLDCQHPYRMSCHIVGGHQVAGYYRRLGKNWNWNT